MTKCLGCLGMGMAALLLGCADPVPPQPVPPPPGWFTDPPPANVVNPHGVATEIILRPGETITTRHIMKAEITYTDSSTNTDHNFDVLMGPYPYTGSVQDAVGSFKNPVPGFCIQAGWVVAAGDWPLVETEMVDAVAQGCTVVAQIVNSKHHRLFVLRNPAGGDPSRADMKLKLKNGGSVMKYLTANEDVYVDATEDFWGDRFITEQLPLASASLPIKEFVRDVKIWANRAKIEETPYPNP